MIRNFWNDQSGFIVSIELILIATVVVLGLIVGMSESLLSQTRSL